jgi:hypothetical protein
LRIYVSHGRNVPNTGDKPATPTEYKQIIETIYARMPSLPVTPSYRQVVPRLVAEGIAGWNWAVREKFFSYAFVTDPRAADVILLFKEGRTGYTQFPYERGQPMVVWLGLYDPPGADDEFRNNGARDMATHEFGHCLGLCHSTCPDDVMVDVFLIVNQPDRQGPETITSANDRASLRALFSMPADLIFYPVK